MLQDLAEPENTGECPFLILVIIDEEKQKCLSTYIVLMHIYGNITTNRHENYVDSFYITCKIRQFSNFK
jgi:hypothetical protein